MRERSTVALDQDGPAAPPRRNGELVFDAPWESRLFGLTMSLHRAGCFEWEAFRRRLIAAIAAAESAEPCAEWSYYRCWARAFEQLLADERLCDPDELRDRATALAARPPGHDH